tara:strand:- start:420 stop:590 length:171 start_codon:yes stop_codon:yes gene_type:complete
MLLPAMMIKTHSPYMELYEIKAVSDQDILSANKNFLERGVPYRVVRRSAVAAVAAA